MCVTAQMITVLQEQAVIEFNVKLFLIRIIFEQEKFIGIEEKHSKLTKYYYNNRFDMFYDKTIEQLSAYQLILDGYCKAYWNSVNMIEHE